MNEKVTGNILLFVGIIIMFFAVIEVFMVFTGKQKPISALTVSSADLSSFSIENFIPGLPTALSGNKPTTSILPTKVINDSINLTMFFFLMSFLLGFGFKLSTLGIQLIRPVYVKMRTKEEPVVQNVSTSPPSAPKS